MRRRLALIPLLALGLLVLPGAADLSAQESGGNLAWVATVTPLPGHGFQFEEGAQQYARDVEAAGGDAVWLAFEVILGPRSGQYMYGMFNAAGADFGNMGGDQEAIEESFRENVAPHAGDYEAQILRRMVDLGTWTPEDPMAPMYEVIRMWVKPGQDAFMSHLMTKVRGVMSEAYPDYRWSVWTAAAGATGSEWILTFPMQDFSVYDDYDPMGFPRALAGAYGHTEMEMLLDGLSEAVMKQTHEVFVVRQDMSVNYPEM